jgi:hypothetical protein
MVTSYQYITLANFEKYCGYAWDSIEATKFSDTNVEYIISTKEMDVNNYLGKTFPIGGAPDGIQHAVLELSRRELFKRLLEEGFRTYNQVPANLNTNIQSDNGIKELIDMYRAKNEENDEVDVIAMSRSWRNGY